MLEDRQIRDLSQREYTYEEFIEALKECDSEGFNCYVGTDSQVVKRKISIVTCVCFYKEGGGSRIFYVKDRLSRKKYPNLRTRMLLEAYQSIEAAMEIEPLLTNKLTIHLDVGSEEKNKTSRYHQELEFLVKSQGYFCQTKPDSWASSAVADRMVKN